MPLPIDIIGLGADAPAGLRPEALRRIEAADFLAGGERHLRCFPAAAGERFVIKDNLKALLHQLRKRFPEQRCVVLASGDPLFYGIGTYLTDHLDPLHFRVEPALSSMQLAFARAGLSWQDAALASIHGRDLRATLLPLLGRQRIGLFTQDGESPARVARFFVERGPLDYEAVVGENLGTTAERLTRWANLGELAGQNFAPLNYLVLRRTRSPNPLDQERQRALAPGIPDGAFVRPAAGPEVMTRQEVRSVAVGKLSGPGEAGDVFWDIGAGLGTVAVEMAVLRPHVEVVAVERDPARAALLRANRERFGAYNIRIVEGTAPEALADEAERPQRVFVGGSGSRLVGILDLIARRLRPAGRLVASFVTLENLALVLAKLREGGWPVEVTEIHVARSDALAGLTALKPQRGVFLVCAEKPGGPHA
jgi:precorrin-6Y C5,15-methyltransferase (decarboxylating)